MNHSKISFFLFIFVNVLLQASELELYRQWRLLDDARLRSERLNRNSVEENRQLMIAIIHQVYSNVVQANPFCFFKYNVNAVLLDQFKKRDDYYQLLFSDEVRKAYLEKLECEYFEDTSKYESIYQNIECYEKVCLQEGAEFFENKSKEDILAAVAARSDKPIDIEKLSEQVRCQLVYYLQIDVVHRRRLRE